MKDGREVTTGHSDDGKTFSPMFMDNVCLENGPSESSGLCKDCDADKSSSEVTSTWGDFESFNEFTPQSELAYEEGSFGENTFATTTPDGEACADPTEGKPHWDAFNLGNESRQECERVFRLSFPEIPVEDTKEDVKNLDELLTSSNEQNISQLLKSRLWLECDPSWHNGDSTSIKSGCRWQDTKGCRDLMTLLGSTAENSSNDGGKTEDALPDRPASYVTGSTAPAGNKYIIQTKLDVAPGSKNGHIFSYQLVLKKSQTDISLPFLTFSGKKTLFSANQFRFNF